ncbi:MAG: hypothetical protein IPL75_13150 [Acidobacteria bacterium]|nr:hypothetical protein [Acidobacteriota bacterium]
MARRADHTSGQCVGVSHVRTDAVAKAAGTALYPQDVPPPGCPARGDGSCAGGLCLAAPAQHRRDARHARRRSGDHRR